HHHRPAPGRSENPAKARLPLRGPASLLRPPHRLRAHLFHHQGPRHHQHRPRLVPPHRPDPPRAMAGLPAHHPQPAPPGPVPHPPHQHHTPPPPPPPPTTNNHPTPPPPHPHPPPHPPNPAPASTATRPASQPPSGKQPRRDPHPPSQPETQPGTPPQHEINQRQAVETSVRPKRETRSH